MLSLSAKDIMTRDVTTIKKGASIEEALRLMACNDISGLPVVDVDGDLVGIITESDVLLKGQLVKSTRFANSNDLFTASPDGVGEAFRRAQADLVEEAMTRKVLTFFEDSLLIDIARAMIEHAINRVPIVRDRKIVGIVSRGDIIRALSKAATGDCNKSVNTGQLIEF